MIRILQCLCGPERHTIVGTMYDDALLPPEHARLMLEMQLEEMIRNKVVRRRCEMCDKDVATFVYEDRVSREQDWETAKRLAMQLEQKQIQTQLMVKAMRKAGNN